MRHCTVCFSCRDVIFTPSSPLTSEAEQQVVCFSLYSLTHTSESDSLSSRDMSASSCVPFLTNETPDRFPATKASFRVLETDVAAINTTSKASGLWMGNPFDIQWRKIYKSAHTQPKDSSSAKYLCDNLQGRDEVHN